MQVIFRDATDIQNGRQRATLKFFVGAKTLKLKSQKLFKFYYHIPHDMEMCRWLFQGFTEIQNGRNNFNFLGGFKKCFWSIFFFKFNIPFLATWGCASDFLKMLPNFKMAARGQLQKFFGALKLQNLKKEIIQILLSHFPRYGDVQVIFLRFYWNSKWPPWINFIFSCAKTEKIEISNNSHCTITLPTIWKCACDFTEI